MDHFTNNLLSEFKTKTPWSCTTAFYLSHLHDNFSKSSLLVVRIVEHFQDLQIRSQSQRMPILELLHSLMLNHRSALKSLGDESLIGITDLVSGEKDPRNLMIIFSILKAVMVEWDITAHAEVRVRIARTDTLMLTYSRHCLIPSSVTFQ